jgi:hypothetical protein
VYKFKISCVGMKGVDIITLTDPVLQDHYGKSMIDEMGVSFGITNIHNVEEDTESKGIRIHMWRMLYDNTYMKNMFSTYIKGSQMLLIVFNETSKDTLNYMKELIAITRREWGDIPIFLVGNKDYADSQPKKVWNESSIRDFCCNQRCTDLYILSKERPTKLEDILIDIAEIYSAFYIHLYPNARDKLKYTA